jgi:hypothetical protein
MICECLASIELAARATLGLRFIPWSEILARAPEAVRSCPLPYRIPGPSGAVVPDGLFGLEYSSDARRMYRFFALEIDRGTMPIARTTERQTSLLAKFDAYRAIIADGLFKRHLGVSTFLVLTLMTDGHRMQETERRLGQCGDNAQLLFKAVAPALLANPLASLLHEPWTRPGLSALGIGGVPGGL